ncbi:MAG: methyltransferase [Candidatus Thiodiazotropha endolucinida]
MSVLNIEDCLVVDRAQKIIARNRERSSQYSVDYLGVKLSIDADVFSPEFGEGSKMLTEMLLRWPRNESAVLEIGTGTGVLSIISSRFSDRIVATDISVKAVGCAGKNVRLNNAQGNISVRCGDLFDALTYGEKFSLVVFNPPFMGSQPIETSESHLISAMYDEGHRTLKRFLAGVSRFLLPHGRILLAFSNCGDVSLLEKEITDNDYNYSRHTIAQGGLEFYAYEIKIKSDKTGWIASD